MDIMPALMKPLHAARFSVLHPLYAEIARTHGRTFTQAMMDLRKAKNTDDEEQIRHADRSATIAGIECIVFTALSLEAQIYDFAARYFGDVYVSEHLDKLDLVSKWLVVPKLVTGQELAKNGRAFGFLREVVRYRNSLAHHKSHGMVYTPGGEADYDGLYARAEKNDLALQKAARASIGALDALPEELFRLSEDDFVALSLRPKIAAKYGRRIVGRDTRGVS